LFSYLRVEVQHFEMLSNLSRFYYLYDSGAGWNSALSADTITVARQVQIFTEFPNYCRF